MRVEYRGYDIEVKREKSLGGNVLLYFSIYRKSDGYECLCDFEDSDETVRDKVKQLKERIDNEHLEINPWNEDDDDFPYGEGGIGTEMYQ